MDIMWSSRKLRVADNSGWFIHIVHPKLSPLDSAYATKKYSFSSQKVENERCFMNKKLGH